MLKNREIQMPMTINVFHTYNLPPTTNNINQHPTI